MKKSVAILGLIAAILSGCKSTQVLSLQKEPGYNARSMRNILVIAVVRKPATQRLLENEFVRQLGKRDGQGVASYTLVREGDVLDRDAWKKLISERHFDSVIVSRLVDLSVVEKDVSAKFLNAEQANGYGYYSSGCQVVYQPGFTVRKETAAMETRIFDAAADKLLWAAHSKTNLEQGRDPEAQVRDFVSHMIGKIY
jgi:hypothetical protein